MITSTLTLAEEQGHAFRHVYPEETVEVADKGSEGSQSDSLRNSVSRQVFSSERRHLKVELDDKGAIQSLSSEHVVVLKYSTHTKDADENVCRDLEEVPVSVVGDLEQDELACAEWVDGLMSTLQTATL